MVLRRNKPGIIGRAATTVARTALITATATTVAGKRASRASATPADPTPAATPVEATPKAATDEAIAKIQKLAEMNKAGILTDDEFAKQKTRLLG
jgi:hypothetical protein